MNRLKQLGILSGLLLFVILLVNLMGYIRRVDAADKKGRAGEASFLASSQQVLIQQLTRKASVLTVHHYFSKEQYFVQSNETKEVMQVIDSQQRELKKLLRDDLGSSAEENTLDKDLVNADSAFSKIQFLISAELQKEQGKEEDYGLQTSLRPLENFYLSSIQKLNKDLREIEKRMDRKLSLLGDVMISSLIAGLILLIIVLVYPAVKLNSKTYRELNEVNEEMRKAQETIRESEAKYRQLFEFNPMPMWISDVESLKFIEVNDQMLFHYGYSREDLNKMTLMDIRPHAEKDRLQKILPTIQNGNELYKMGQWIHEKKSGERIVVEIMTQRLQYHDKEAILVIAHDVTQNVKLQQELMDSRVAQQRAIAKASLSVQERERNEIGKELHDNVNQILTSVKLHLEMVSAPDAQGHIAKSVEGIRTAIGEIRRLSKSLVPSTLNDMGLLNAIEDLMDNMTIHSDCRMQFIHFNFDEDRFGNDFKLTLFRIIQEQLTNVAKHARAKEVVIHLECNEEGVRIVISDDGVGFEKNKKRKGIGISNIINRADMFGGEVIIDSHPGEGCSLEVQFPKEKTEAL